MSEVTAARIRVPKIKPSVVMPQKVYNRAKAEEAVIEEVVDDRRSRAFSRASTAIHSVNNKKTRTKVFTVDHISVPFTKDDDLTLLMWEKAYDNWERQFFSHPLPNPWGKPPMKSKKNYIANKLKKKGKR